MAAPPPPLDRRIYERYLPLVRRIAMRLVRSLPSTIALDDLLSAGWMGLVEAARRRGAGMPEEEFEAYASQRVRGAMLDHLRSADPMSRKLRGASRRITAAIQSLTARLGRPPEEAEIAGDVGLDVDTYRVLLGQIAQADAARLEIGEMDGGGDDAAPDVIVSRRQMVDRIAAAVEALPDRLKLVMGLYYQEACSFREVGEVLGVTESRVCQLHSEAVHRIRAHVAASAAAENGPRTGRKSEEP